MSSALSGWDRVRDLALIYAMVGEESEALDKIEYLLSNHSWATVPLFRLDPRWDPLRGHPRFQALMERFRLDE